MSMYFNILFVQYRLQDFFRIHFNLAIIVMLSSIIFLLSMFKYLSALWWKTDCGLKLMQIICGCTSYNWLWMFNFFASTGMGWNIVQLSWPSPCSSFLMWEGRFVLMVEFLPAGESISSSWANLIPLVQARWALRWPRGPENRKTHPLEVLAEIWGSLWDDDEMRWHLLAHNAVWLELFLCLTAPNIGLNPSF